jgi:mono/diheme cytochrome c family protein
LNDQTVKTESPGQRTVLIALVLMLAIVLAVLGIRQLYKPDPYIKEVLSRSGDTVQGHAIFQMNCAGCHGLMADGKVGPSLKGVSARKSRTRLIDQVISGKTPPMPQFQPNPQEMADVLSYLKSL